MSTADAAERPATPRGGLLARHPLISFFVMAFAFSWIVWSPWVLSEDGVGLVPYKLTNYLKTLTVVYHRRQTP